MSEFSTFEKGIGLLIIGILIYFSFFNEKEVPQTSSQSQNLSKSEKVVEEGGTPFILGKDTFIWRDTLKAMSYTILKNSLKVNIRNFKENWSGYYRISYIGQSYYVHSKDLKSDKNTDLSKSNYKNLDDKFGFRNIKLETPLSTFSNLEKVYNTRDKEDHVDQECYSPTSFEKKIGDFELSNIYYYFYKDKLLEIEITVEGCGSTWANRQGVADVLEAAYGPGLNSYGYYSWWGEKVVMSYLLGANDFLSEGIISIYSLNYMVEYQKDKKQKIIDASKDL